MGRQSMKLKRIIVIGAGMCDVRVGRTIHRESIGAEQKRKLIAGRSRARAATAELEG